MEERNVRHSRKSAGNKGLARFSRLCLMLLLCLVSNAATINSVLARKSSLRATRHSRNGSGWLKPSAINPPHLLSSGEAFAKLASSQDQLWHEINEVGGKRSRAVTGIAPKRYRTLSLNESAQNHFLRQAPMEFTRTARENRVVMALPMPD